VNTTTTRFTGRIGSVPNSSDYGFISLSTVEGSDGQPHGLSTQKDIFIHQDDCSTMLRPGLVVEFDAIPRIGHNGEFRATGAIEVVTAELVPSRGTVIPGFNTTADWTPTTELQLASAKLPIHFRMKAVPMETVQQVAANKPMPTVPRSFGTATEEQQSGLINAFLLHLFPHMAQFGTDFNVLSSSDAVLDEQLRTVSEDLSTIGMGDHVIQIRKEVERFKSTRDALRFTHEEGLVRPDTIIPIHYLPDLFMAVPVWFFYTDQNGVQKIKENNKSDDPHVHEWTKYFCDLLPGNRRWADTFQLYNRRLRTLADYGGDGFDVIPPAVARRLKWAVKAFDFVVIATPYHDLAGQDWQDAAWLRSIDPYVLGFKRGIPYMFVLARFSDSGTFPLYHQLVGDTIEFLRKNKQRLRTLDNFRPNWHGIPGTTWFSNNEAGRHLISHVDQLLQAFERGNLFEWLRMEDSQVPARQ
jgi:hypothetical protein